jgi:phage terminase large subunit
MEEVTVELADAFKPLTEPTRYKGAYGGRGSGKSHFFATMVILRMASEDGLRVVCVREVQRSIADSVKTLLEDKIAACKLEGFFKVTETEIAGANGSRCIFRGMQNHTAASIKSLEGFDVAWVEEAQTISQKSLDLLTPTIRKKGSEIWFSWNPEAPDDPVDVLLRKQPPDGSVVIEANWDSNPWFPDELRADMERDKKRDPDKWSHVWQGQYRGLSEARVFRNWRIDELNPPENVVWFYGADWGFARDASAALRCCVMENSTLYIDSEVYEVGTPNEKLPTLLDGLPDARLWPMIADSARPETIDYVKRHGFPKIRAAKKGKGSVEDGVMFLQGMDIVVHPLCANAINEFRNYAYKTDRHTGEILPVIEDANNHLMDALRYAVEGLHRKGKQLPTMFDKPRRRDRYERDEDEDATNWKTL